MSGSLAEYTNYLLYDGVINPGNSGGPSCNIGGDIVSVNTAVLMPGAVGGSYAAGVPANEAVAFIESNLTGFSPEEATSGNTESWEAAVEHVAKSTVQVVILQDPVKIGIEDRSGDERVRKGDFDAFEDPWCMACHGWGKIKCPNRDCANGTVRSYRTETYALPDGRPFSKRIPIRVKCPTCNGKGKVDCPHCTSGIDPVFF
jgi:hypothetical protein